MKRRVLDVVAAVIERQDETPIPSEPDRVAFVASYSASRHVSKSLSKLIDGLVRGGYFVVLIRASDDNSELIWSDGRPSSTVVVHKSNVGYDFGSWATGLSLFPMLARAPLVLLANDSLLGPFAGMQAILDAFESIDTDVWGVTNTTEVIPHLQSYMVGFKGGILADAPLHRFWSDIRVQEDKDLVVLHYEVGLTRLLLHESYVVRTWFHHEAVADDGRNPSLWGWKRLLDLGFPFVKRQLITLPSMVRDGNEVPEVVGRLYGTDPRDWL